MNLKFVRRALLGALLCGSLHGFAYDFKVDGIAYNILSASNRTVEVTYDSSSKYEGEISIPGSVIYSGNIYTVNKVGYQAFFEAPITSVTIASPVNEIGEQAFSMTKLNHVSLPTSLRVIGRNAFSKCDNLSELNLPEGLQTIGMHAFWKSGLEYVVLPASVNSISLQAFEYCTKLQSVYEKSTNPSAVSIVSSTFSGGPFENATLYVPKGCVNAYKSDANWKLFSKIEEIGVNAFGLIQQSVPSKMLPGESCNVTYSYAPSFISTSEFPITWSSSDASVASVDNAGRVTANRHGIATIYAKMGNKESSVKVDVDYSPATSVSIDESNIPASIYPWCPFTLSASVLPETANQLVSYSSSDTSVATVDATGKVTPRKHGVATITATAGNGITGSVEISVKYSVPDGIKLSAQYLEAVVGEQQKLTVTVTPAEARQTVTWISDNQAVVTVDDEGRLTPKSPGSATITATCPDKPGIKASCTIKVYAAPVSVEIDESNVPDWILPGDKFSIKAMVLPSDSRQMVTFASSDEAVARIDSKGNIHALNPGNATITASATGSVFSTLQITVHYMNPEAVTLNHTQAELHVIETLQLSATVAPFNAEQRVSWTSSNPEIASIDSNGKVTALSPGTAEITALAANSNDVKATCSLTVLPALVESISLDRTSLEIELGKSDLLTATVLSDYATDKTLRWTSSDPSIVLVNEDGMVSGLAIGTSTVTAATTDGSELTASCEVTVKGTTGISSAEIGNLTLNTDCGRIWVDGAAAESVLAVFTASGACVYSGKDRMVENLCTGIYIVTIEGNAFKVKL